MYRTLRQTLAWFLITICGVYLIGCGGGGGAQSGVPSTTSQTQTVSAATGGVITLSTGARLAVPSGALSLDSPITFSIPTERGGFTAEGQYLYEIAGANLPTAFTLSCTGPIGLPVDAVAAALINPTADGVGTAMPLTVSYTATTGAITASTAGRTTHGSRSGSSRQIIIEVSPPTVPAIGSRHIRMPYYEQTLDGGCVPTSAAMLARLYGGTKQPLDWAVLLGYTDEEPYANWGLKPGRWETDLVRHLQNTTGKTAKCETYYKTDKIAARLVQLLDQGKPVMLFIPWHALVVVGYEATPELTFLVNDPKGTATNLSYDTDQTTGELSGGLAARYPWRVIKKKYDTLASFVDYFPITWIDAQASPSTGTLTSIGIPNKGIGGTARFKVVTPSGGVGYINLAWRPAMSGHLAWETTQKYPTIPSNASQIELQLPLWNASNTNQFVTTHITIMAPNNKKLERSINFTVPATGIDTYGSPNAKTAIDIPIAEIRALQPLTASVLAYSMKVELLQGGNLVDQYVVPFSLDPPAALSINPKSGKVGETIVITGMAFGATKGQVRFRSQTGGTASALVSSWTTSEVHAVVPQNVATGPVEVILPNNQTALSDTFLVDAPSITSITPGSMSPYGYVAINGEGLFTQGIPCTVIAGTANPTALTTYGTLTNTRIVVKVPTVSQAGTLNIRVLNGGVPSNTMPLTVNDAFLSVVSTASIVSAGLHLPLRYSDGTLESDLGSRSNSPLVWSGTSFSSNWVDGNNSVAITGAVNYSAQQISSMSVAAVKYGINNKSYEEWGFTITGITLTDFYPGPPTLTGERFARYNRDTALQDHVTEVYHRQYTYNETARTFEVTRQLTGVDWTVNGPKYIQAQFPIP